LPEQQVRAWLEQLGPTRGEQLVEQALAAEAHEPERALDLYKAALAEEPANADARTGVARLELAMRAASADEDSLRASNDPDSIIALADIEFARGEVETAVERLIDLVRTGGDARERARARLVDLLDTLAPDDPRALKARRELAAALY
jgi:putative thioredoxin